MPRIIGIILDAAGAIRSIRAIRGFRNLAEKPEVTALLNKSNDRRE